MEKKREVREMEEGKKQLRTDDELEQIAFDLFKSLKPMKLTVMEIKDVINHMVAFVDCITYGG